MSTLQFLALIETFKERIISAFGTLKSTTLWERTLGTGQELDGVLMGGQGFGATMETLCNYLGLEYENTFALAAVFALLLGSPNHGPGQIDTRRYNEQYDSKGKDFDCVYFWVFCGPLSCQYMDFDIWIFGLIFI
ncbi:hypothetical protein V6N13_067889 [Hibiscus sabdariffa]|uniref:Uncharacterized protein n=1 Tax=Hibiscus sabdariffa TaxID=183260 RepID=A0ABR2DV81_9ROSI